MLQDKSRTLVGWILALGTGAVTLLVTPYSAFDPVNVPKMSLLAFLAFVVGSILILNLGLIKSSAARLPMILTGFFILDLFLILLSSPQNKTEQFYGIAGRNTGFLTYLSLCLLMVGAIIFSENTTVSLFVRQALLTGTALVLYGFIQSLGKDIFPWISAYSNPVIGTFGNPDFQSAFMGIFGTICFGLALSKSKVIIKALYFIMFISATFVAYKTHALQGLVCLAAGVGFILFLYVLALKKKFLTTGVTAIGCISILVLLLSLFNVGPLANFLYKTSLTARGFYWSAAIEMLKTHPFLGVGLDGYGDWYRRSRSNSAVVFNPELATNAAHNVYFDFAANGGFPLILLYVAILFLVLKSILRVTRRSINHDGKFIALSGAWLAYQAQAFVSINQIGLAIWGWVLSGLIIGYEISTRTPALVDHNDKKKESERTSSSLTMRISLALALGGLTGALVGFPPYLAVSKYYESFRTSDVRYIGSAALIRPFDRARLIQTSKLFESKGFGKDAIRLIRIAVLEYPDSTEAWQLLSNSKESTSQEKKSAESELKRLDPLNPRWNG